LEDSKKILVKYKDHFTKINEALDECLNSGVDLVVDMGNHCLLGKGKRIRPLLFVLSCHLCDYRDDDIYRFSTIFEYIHASSLLHDDVLDNSDTRRKRPSTNHLWGNHAAILEGDFLYSKALSIAVGTGSLSFLRMVTDTTTQMTEGQINELFHTDDWNTTREQYMEIISAKTAALISAACACGAILAGADSESEEALKRFGHNMGLAFQLTDDVLDYTSSEEVFGKPVGKDLKEGKITLPLIYTLSTVEKTEKKRFEDLFKSHRATEKDYRDLTGLVRTSGALDKIQGEALAYVEEAEDCLTGFADSPVKRNLFELNRYIIDRQY
jgi:octaprenyl-diphosphate synthase